MLFLLSGTLQSPTLIKEAISSRSLGRLPTSNQNVALCDTVSPLALSFVSQLLSGDLEDTPCIHGGLLGHSWFQSAPPAGGCGGVSHSGDYISAMK